MTATSVAVNPSERHLLARLHATAPAGAQMQMQFEAVGARNMKASGAGWECTDSPTAALCTATAATGSPGDVSIMVNFDRRSPVWRVTGLLVTANPVDADLSDNRWVWQSGP